MPQHKGVEAKMRDIIRPFLGCPKRRGPGGALAEPYLIKYDM